MTTAVLIHTCDKYSWTWPIFFSCLKQKWDFSLPTYFANETNDISVKNVTQIKTDSGSWSKRLLFALTKIPAKNIIYLQEDFWTIHINYDYLKVALDVHSHYRADITKLGTNFEFTVNRIGGTYNLPINQQTQDSQYVMSHQPIAIFDKDYLHECLLRRPDDGPSEFELGITKDVNEGTIGTKSICIGPTINPNNSIIWRIQHGVRKGQLIPEAEHFLKRHGYEAFIPTVR